MEREEYKISDGKILVVDDDVSLLKLISSFLSEENHTVDTVDNGRDTFKMLADNDDYDLIILDLMMPDISGYEVCKKLRKRKSLSELPVLMLTARNEVDDVVRGFDAGANDYLSKPFDRMELTARAKTLIKLKKLAEANKALQEALEVKNQFMQMTIHDLKNPLNVVMGLAKMILRDIPEDSDNHELLELVLESSDLMSSLVNELLDALKIETGQLRIEKVLVNMNEIAEICYQKNINMAKLKKQELVFNTEPDDKAFILADRLRLQEIMENLISNAIKYSPYNKKIEINVKRCIDGKNEECVCFEVIDEGPGFTDEDKEKLFRKFQKLSAQPTGGEKSSGLGLSIVKQLVDLLGGSIWVESENGNGAKFVVSFYAEEPQFD